MSVRPSPTRLMHAAKSGAVVTLRRCSLTSRSAFFLDQFASVQASTELVNLLLGDHRIECDAREPPPEFVNLLSHANPLTLLCLRPLPASSAHCHPLRPIVYREASIPPSPTHSDPPNTPPSSTRWPHPASLPHRRRGAPSPPEDEHEQQKTLRRSPPSRICPSSPLPLCRLAQPRRYVDLIHHQLEFLLGIALELDAFKYLQIVASYGGCTGANNLDKNELSQSRVYFRGDFEWERITVKSVGIKKEFDADRVFGQEYAQGSLSDNFFAIIVPTEYDCLTASTRKKEIVDVIVKAFKST
ncbi:hypothetical protein ZEAMMB73_Zm00001d007064 [Zea mays]|uniref:Uncharacterized protein n=1 Tax=Zea mays TaxID=4577 RepID=A0A1D6F2L5_MAIZE|nr:hypothetical protein ZEAMMB73_Zm00001d007064 [Zea mays]ONM25677.1 hypothetical protein ZEAMMB73_Zm00001d007064 [Zea mays]